MRTTTTTTTVTVTVPNAALLAAESLLNAVRELKKAGGAYYLGRLVNDDSGSPHELARETLIALVCEMLLEDGDPVNADLTYERARQVVADAIDSGKNIGQQLVGGMGWTVIPTYEEAGASAVVSVFCPIHRVTNCSPMLNGCSYGRQPAPEPGACSDSVCSVLHADPSNPLHPPDYTASVGQRKPGSLCTIHNMPDCSPAFNGCPGPARVTEPVARYRESSWVINGGAADYGS